MAAKSQFKGKLAETFNVEIGGGYDQFFNRLMELKENIAMQKEGFSRAGEELINIFRGHIVRNIGPGNEPWPLYAKPVLEYTVEHTSTKTGKTSTYGPYTKKWFNPGSTLLFRGGQLYDQIKMLELDQQEVSAGIRYDDCAYAGVHNFGYTVSSAELMYIKGYGEPALGKKMGVKTEVKIPQR